MSKNQKNKSTWIKDLTWLPTEFGKQDGIAMLETKYGQKYLVYGVSALCFQHWKWSLSRGRFYHKYIRPDYNVKVVEGGEG